MKLLLTSDWHVRDDTPVCRTDDFWKVQWSKINWLIEQANRFDAHILNGGDLFNRGRPVQSQVLELMLIRLFHQLKKSLRMWIVPGNHDLPFHSMGELERSSLGVLFEMGVIANLHGVGTYLGKESELFLCGRGWGYDLNEVVIPDGYSKKDTIGVVHTMVCTKGNEYPGASDAELYLKKHPQFKLIVTGDNHKRFVVRDGDRLLVNPGSLTRQAIDADDPVVYLYDTDKDDLVELPVPIEKDVISSEHRDVVVERDEKIAVFVESMKNEYDSDLDFEGNLKAHLVENPVSKETEKLIWEAVGA